MERFTDTDSITVKVTKVTKTELKKRTKKDTISSSRRMTNVSTKYLKNKLHTEAATETVFENICSFFPGATFYNFPGGSICSSNRHEFSRRVYLFVEQT